MLPNKAKFVEWPIISVALSFWMKHLVIGQLQKPAKYSAFHWSPSRSKAFIGQLLGTSGVVHLPKRTIARPVNVAWQGKICWVLYNQSSSIVLDETSSYWSVTKTC